MKKLLLLAAAAMSMAACADSTAPTNSSLKAPTTRANDFKCESGYVVAYDENGNPYCAPIQQDAMARGASRP